MQNDRDFKDYIYFFPFGRFRPDRVGSRDHGNLLIGREGERSYFIDSLTGAGKRGAFLITGRRGVGKTTFVESCLAEYEANVFRRFLRGKVGRSFWDLSFVVAGFALCLYVLLTMSDLLEFLVPQVPENGLVLVPLLMALVILTLPLAYAWYVFFKNASGASSDGFALPMFSQVSLAVLFACCIPAGAPVYALMAISVIVSLFIGLSSVLLYRDTPKPNHKRLYAPFVLLSGILILVLLAPRLAPILNLTLPISQIQLALFLGIGCPIWLVLFLSSTSFGFFNATRNKEISGDDEQKHPGRGAMHLSDNNASQTANALKWTLGTFGVIAFLFLTVALFLGSGSDPLFTIQCYIPAIVAGGLSFFLFRKTVERRLYQAYFNERSNFLGIVVLVIGVPAGIFFWGRVIYGQQVAPFWHSLFWAVFVALVAAQLYHLFHIEQKRGSFLSKPKRFAPVVMAITLLISCSLNLGSLSGTTLVVALSTLISMSVTVIGIWAGHAKGQRYALQTANTSNPPSGTPIPIKVFLPPIEFLLFLKGAIAVVIFLQLVYPLAASFMATPSFGSHPAEVNLPPSPDSALTKIAAPRPIYKIYEDQRGQGQAAAADEAQHSYYTLFGHSHEEMLWLLLALVLGVLFYYAEYEWINRSFIAQRQTVSLDRGPRRHFLAHHDLDATWLRSCRNWLPKIDGKPFDEKIEKFERLQKHRFRAFDQATLPYLTARAWLPTITVRVNLGFDKLDHRGVTHAMLFGLANEYRRTFLSWRSGYNIASKITMLLVVSFLVAGIGSAYFDMPLSRNSVALSWQSDRNSFQICDDWLEPTVAKVDQAMTSAPMEKDARTFYSRALHGQHAFPKLVCHLFPSQANGLLRMAYADIVNIKLDTRFDPLVQRVKTETDSEPDGALFKLRDESGQLAPPYRPIFSLLHLNNGPPIVVPRPNGGQGWVAIQERSLTLRSYHIALFGIVYWLLSYLLWRLPILPYRRVLDRIEGMMNALTQTQTKRSKAGRFGIERFVSQVFSNEDETEASRDVLDPRSVELALMELLEEVQRTEGLTLLLPIVSVNMPTPTLHFVFDELDKIGGVVGAEETALGVGEAEQKAVDAERQRTYELHRLLSDMKRVISSAPARFIFVGGRALHDEWLRDVNRTGTRQPLLSGIFDKELYLPSLLVDHSRATQYSYDPSDTSYDPHASRQLDSRIKQYVYRLHQYSIELDRDIQATRLLPFFAKKPQQEQALDFDESRHPLPHKFNEITTSFLKMGRGSISANKKDNMSWLLDDLSHYLAFRSAGSPKRLRELLQNFVRPAGSFFHPEDDKRYALVPDRDMLVFDHKDLFRLQFIAAVFRHIDRQFGDALKERDDKIAVNVFFLFDYLMKLHGRAFSMSSLERLDELAHIHRAPDLRRTLEKSIEASSERFFHRLLNGLYTFRFQSDLVMEIRYLSRISEPEMAALNFTLDESQELKTTYNAMMSVSGQPNADIVSALGELFEFDQAYDVARSHYERAIVMADEELARLVGQQVSTTPEPQEKPHWRPANSLSEAARILISSEPFQGASSAFDMMLNGSNLDRRMLNTYMPWAVRRLRLMMQVGLTFEQQSGDEERAQVIYHQAHMLSRAITDVATDMNQDWPERPWMKLLLENLPLIFQPLFSAAWIAEKLDSSVDTSLTMVEREVIELCSRFDFIRYPNMTKSAEDMRDKLLQATGEPKFTAFQHGLNNALIAAEVHNKAGDLYFYKGRERLSDWTNDDQSFDRVLETLETNSNGGETSNHLLVGYVSRSIYHYACALHEVRRYAVFRHFISRARLNSSDANTHVETHRQNSWPTFVNLTAASSLVDIGEAMIATQTTLPVFRDVTTVSEPLPDFEPAQDIADLDSWFNKFDEDTRFKTGAGEQQPEKTEIEKLLGQWRGASQAPIWPEREEDRRKIELTHDFKRPHAVLLGLSFGALGAEYTRRAGYPKAAGSEYELTLRNALRLIKNAIVFCQLKECDTVSQANTAKFKKQLAYLATIAKAAMHCAEKACEHLVDPVTPAGHQDPRYQVGLSVPVSLAEAISTLQTWIEFLNLMASNPVLDASDIVAQFQGYSDSLEVMLAKWFADDGKEDYDIKPLQTSTPNTRIPGARARNRLLRLCDRHHFPGLVAMEARKTLIDAVLLGDKLIDESPVIEISNRDMFQERSSEALSWLHVLIRKEGLFDAPMHFTPTELAESCALAVVCCGADEFRHDAQTYLRRAQESFSMGREYYKNIKRLHYLFDDFNDRSRHSQHARSMFCVEILALLEAKCCDS